MNDTTHRFLTAVLARVPEASLVELRLFPAIRQGAIESAVAVLAVEPGWDTPVEAVAEGVDEVLADAELHVADDPESTAGDEAGADLGDAVIEALGRAPVELADVAPPADAAPMTERLVEREAVLADAAPVETDEPDETISLGDILALPGREPEEQAEVTPDAVRRLAILSARYRLVLKGPDRGKWNLEVIHQADAPLETLDRVIAGVMRRSGEEAEPGRFSREQLRAALDAPVWARSA